MYTCAPGLAGCLSGPLKRQVTRDIGNTLVVTGGVVGRAVWGGGQEVQTIGYKTGASIVQRREQSQCFVISVNGE